MKQRKIATVAWTHLCAIHRRQAGVSSFAPEAHIHADIPLHAQSISPAVLQKHARRIREVPLAQYS